MLSLNDEINKIKGIGDKTALLFTKVSVFCVKDLLNFFPRYYVEYPEIMGIKDLKPHMFGAVKARVSSKVSLFGNKGKSYLSFNVSDNTGTMKIYYFNMPYLKNKFVSGAEYIFYGSVTFDKKGAPLLSNPKLFSDEEYEKARTDLSPVYPLCKGLTNNIVSKAVRSALESVDEIDDYLNENQTNILKLIDIKKAYYDIHFPETLEHAYTARNRLAFDEFFIFVHKMTKLKGMNIKQKANAFEYDKRVDDFIDALPYKLTDGQLNAVKEISKDLSSGYQMNRLLQGDVGCGKTIVAFISALITVYGGGQCAIMAPTLVLAMQHFNDLVSFSEKYGLPFKPVLLTGDLKVKERRVALAGIADGSFNVIIGTHALITDKVEYNNLALSICDEQHRFGVKQRLGLIEKGSRVHQLVMSATPIPRTLGLILYGDLDISTIMEKPSMRLPLKNAVVGPEYRPKNYTFIKEQIDKGRQCYIICPMVEEGDMEGLKAATEYSEEIRPFFPDNIRIGCLHGKMKPKDKDDIMMAFKNHELDILVSTTVIEVGVNVPNASVMMIENAERFGLSQLHQLRGRVGRGEYQSYVIYLTENNSKKNMDRLGLLVKTNDGFKIASEDLKLRGPGDFFGYRQSGEMSFKIADIYGDAEILKKARDFYDHNYADESDKDMVVRFDNYIKRFDKEFLCL